MPGKYKSKGIGEVNSEVLLNELTYLGTYRTLSNILPYISDRTPAQYKRMRMYPMCWLGLNFIKLGLPAIPPVFESEDEEAKLITEAAFKPIWNKLITEALEILDFGWKPAEVLWKSGKLNYKKEESLETFEGLLLKAPKGLDPETVQLLIHEGTGNLRGFRQFGVTEDVLIEENKVIVYTHILSSGQYYGTSALEPAYPYWFDANLNRQFHMRWLERKGVGIFKGLYPIGETEVEGSQVDNQDIMLELLSSVIEGRVVALPSKRDDNGNLLWDIAFLNDEDKTDPFINRAKYIDESILRALIIPEKALTQGEIGARASVEAYQDVFLSRKESLLDDIVATVDEYLVKPFVNYNFGADVEVHVYAGEFSSAGKELAGKLVEKLIDKGEVKVRTQWLIDKTSIPLEEVEEPEQIQEPEVGIEPELPEDPEDLAINVSKKQARKSPEAVIKVDNTKMIKALKETEKKLSEIKDRWRLMSRLEDRYQLSAISGYLDDRAIEFRDSLVAELNSQQDRVLRYISKNYSSDAKFVSVINNVEISAGPIKRLFREFLNDVYRYVYDRIQSGVEGKNRLASMDTTNQFIGFRVDISASKLASDFESALKYQLSSDMGSRLSEAEILDRVRAMTQEFLSDSKMMNISETEIGFTLGKTIEDYIIQNKKNIASGALKPEKKIERLKYSAIMDGKVCPLCSKLDGMVVDTNSSIRYKYDTPLHYLCRCVWLPVTVDDINDPDIADTDLTLGAKGRPITIDEVTTMIGTDASYKKFSEEPERHILYCNHVEHNIHDQSLTKMAVSSMVQSNKEFRDELRVLLKKIEEQEKRAMQWNNVPPSITIPMSVQIDVPESKQANKTIVVQRDKDGKMIGAEIHE